MVHIYPVQKKDYQDEALVPLDYNTAGLIRDDQLYNIFIKNIPSDCNVFCMVDACHSGTVLDLPYVYRLDTGINVNRNDEMYLILLFLVDVGTVKQVLMLI